MAKWRIVSLLLLATLIVTLTIGIACAIPPTETVRPDADVWVGWGSWPNTEVRYDHINEAIADGDNTYVFSRGPGSPPLVCGLSDISGGYAISGVTVYALAKSSGAADDEFKIKIWNPGMSYNDGTSGASSGEFALPAGSDYQLYSFTWTNNPFTGLSWTVSDVNELQVGVTHTSGDGVVHVTQLYVEVNEIPEQVIPEVPLGPMAALGSMGLAFATTTLYRRAKPKQ